MLGWLLPTCRTSCPIWPSTSQETPGVAVATAPRRWPLPGVRTWSGTSPGAPAGTTTCWRPMWSTTTAAWRSCWRPCVTSAHRGVGPRCCGPTRSVSRRTWASPSTSRAASAPRCSWSSRRRGWGSTRPWPGSDPASGLKGRNAGVWWSGEKRWSSGLNNIYQRTNLFALFHTFHSPHIIFCKEDDSRFKFNDNQYYIIQCFAVIYGQNHKVNPKLCLIFLYFNRLLSVKANNQHETNIDAHSAGACQH